MVSFRLLQLFYKISFWRGRSIVRFLVPMLKNSGRNNRGGITMFHRGGGCRRSLKIIDFRRFVKNIPAFILRYERDSKRTAPLVSICYSNGVLSYILASRNLLIHRPLISSYKTILRSRQRFAFFFDTDRLLCT